MSNMNDCSGRSRRRYTKPLLYLIPILALVLVLLSSVVVVKKSSKARAMQHLHIHNHLQKAHSACEGTLYPDLCVSTISLIPDLATKSLPEIISAILDQTMYEVRLSAANISNLERGFKGNKSNTIEEAAIQDCQELFDKTMAELTVSLADLNPKKVAVSKHYHDLQTFLSAAMTNQYTCLDGFAHTNMRNIVKKGLHNISHHVSNSLVILNKVPGINDTKSKSEIFPE